MCPPARGYPDQLAARLRGSLPHLRLVKLGCSGETTSTMIHGGICRYPAGSQLAQAARFLRAHRGRTALITIDIGANDPNSCILTGGLSSVLPCAVSRLPQVGRNLSTILATLRAAAGQRVLIVGMTYYVPELGLWHTGKTGRQIAILTGAVAAGANQLLVARYRHYGARVANVFAAFRSSDFGQKNGHAHGGAGGPGQRSGRPGQRKSGQPEAGQPEAGQSESGRTESGRTESGQTESGRHRPGRLGSAQRGHDLHADLDVRPSTTRSQRAPE